MAKKNNYFLQCDFVSVFRRRVKKYLYHDDVVLCAHQMKLAEVLYKNIY